MTTINVLLQGLIDGLLYPFRGLPPLVGLTLVSLVTGIGVLLVYKVTSNQEKLAAVKRRIHAGFFEIRLFNDDLLAILRAMGAILRHNFSYVALSFVPLLWMIVPLVLVIGQLQYHYGYQGFAPGDETLLTVELRDDWQERLPGSARPPIELTAPAGVRVEAGPVWIPALNQLTWRIAADDWGSYALEFGTGEEIYTKTMEVSQDVLRCSPVRPSSAFFDQLLYPVEDPLPAAAPIKSIALVYPAGDLGILSQESSWVNPVFWMIVFFILSIVFGFALRKPLKVTI